MVYCLLGLGSNLKHPKRQLCLAQKHIKRLPASLLLEVAPYYKNPAWGRKNLPNYYNTVLLLQTRLCPVQLLAHCLKIEQKQHRSHRVRYGARTIDVDILKYGEMYSKRAALVLPHPHMQERIFVQLPLRALKNRRMHELR